MWELGQRSHKLRDSTQPFLDFHDISSSSESVDDVELADLCSETDEEEKQPGTSAAADFFTQSFEAP